MIKFNKTNSDKLTNYFRTSDVLAFGPGKRSCKVLYIFFLFGEKIFTDQSFKLYWIKSDRVILSFVRKCN